MPVYEYYCTECGEVFEKLQKAGGEICRLKCPNCNTDEVKRVLSSFSSLCSSENPSCNAGKRSGFG